MNRAVGGVVRTFVLRWPQGIHACETRCRALISRGILLGSRNGMLVQHKVDARLQMQTSRPMVTKIPNRARRGQGGVRGVRDDQTVKKPRRVW